MWLLSSPKVGGVYASVFMYMYLVIMLYCMGLLVLVFFWHLGDTSCSYCVAL